MRAARLEQSVTIAAAPERVFAWADDSADTGWHMRRRSRVMLGTALKLGQVSAAACGVCATCRWSGSLFGLTVNFTATVLTRRHIAKDVNQAALVLTTAESVEARQKGLVQAEEEARVIRKRFESGRGIQLEVLDARWR